MRDFPDETGRQIKQRRDKGEKETENKSQAMPGSHQLPTAFFQAL